ncbi:hypothetical protein ACJX0J_002818 [Zea mays]
MIEVFLFGIVLGLIPITLAGLFYPQIQGIPTLIDLPTTAHNEERINSCATSLFQINFLVISCFWSHIIKEGKDYYSLLGISPKQKKYKGSWARVSDHMYSNTEGGFSMRDIKTYLSVAPVLSTLWFGALAGLLIEINRLFPDAFYSYARDRILRDMTKISPF